MTAIASPTDAEINRAIDIITRHNPTLANQAIARLNATEDGTAFDEVAHKIVAAAQKLEQRTQAVAPQPRQEAAPPGVAPLSDRSDRAVAAFALLIGLPFWLEGARYTRDGWIAFINWLCARFSIPAQVPPLSWQVALGVMIALGLAYSYIEMGRQPFVVPKRPAQYLQLAAWRMSRSWQAWVVWLVLIASDVGTTYSGIRQPHPDLAALQAIGQGVVAAIIYGIIITFIPDRLIRFGWRGLRGK